MALDLVTATDERRYLLAIVVSQDSDFGSAVRLAKEITSEQSRSLVIESAFPVGPGPSQCLDLDFTDYRPSAP